MVWYHPSDPFPVTVLSVGQVLWLQIAQSFLEVSQSPGCIKKKGREGIGLNSKLELHEWKSWVEMECRKLFTVVENLVILVTDELMWQIPRVFSLKWSVKRMIVAAGVILNNYKVFLKEDRMAENDWASLIKLWHGTWRWHRKPWFYNKMVFKDSAESSGFVGSEATETTRGCWNQEDE